MELGELQVEIVQHEVSRRMGRDAERNRRSAIDVEGLTGIQAVQTARGEFGR